MAEITSEADISCPAETIFGLISDFRGQDRWLAKSAVFRGTEVSPGPVTLGTTYREPGLLGVRHGKVIEYDPPSKIAFRQPMTLTLHAGTIDIILRYSLTSSTGGSTRVTRVVTVATPWPLRLIEPLIVRAIRAESRRTLLALKVHADNLPNPSQEK